MPKVPLGFSAVPFDLFKEERVDWHTTDIRPGDWLRYDHWTHPMPVVDVDGSGPETMPGHYYVTVVNISGVPVRLTVPPNDCTVFRYPVMAAWVDFVDLMREYESDSDEE